jgi:hypothetical protein
MRCGGKPRPVALTRIGGSGRLRDLRLNSLVLKNAQRETPPAVSDPPAGFGPCISIRSHCRPNSDTGLCEVKARGEIRVPHSLLLSPAWPKTGGAFSSLPPPAFCECRHGGLAGRGIAVGRTAIFVVPKGYRPHPRRHPMGAALTLKMRPTILPSASTSKSSSFQSRERRLVDARWRMRESFSIGQSVRVHH